MAALRTRSQGGGQGGSGRVGRGRGPIAIHLESGAAPPARDALRTTTHAHVPRSPGRPAVHNPLNRSHFPRRGSLRVSGADHAAPAHSRAPVRPSGASPCHLVRSRPPSRPTPPLGSRKFDRPKSLPSSHFHAPLGSSRDFLLRPLTQPRRTVSSPLPDASRRAPQRAPRRCDRPPLRGSLDPLTAAPVPTAPVSAGSLKTRVTSNPSEH
jgi:hypothetical protein